MCKMNRWRVYIRRRVFGPNSTSKTLKPEIHRDHAGLKMIQAGKIQNMFGLA